MRRSLTFGLISITVAFVLMSASASAAPLIVSISADTLLTNFDPSQGAMGRVNFEQYTPIEIDYDDGTTQVFEDGHFHLWTDLFQDDSAGGMANGYFESGGFTITDGTDTLLEGVIDWMRLIELFDGAGVIGGEGILEVTGGTMENQFGTSPLGEIFDITFHVVPSGVEDFSEAFTGISDITIMPMHVPEPGTLLMLAAGLSGLARLAFRRKT